ncbi:hydantoinase B/oxoprolinase family protein, partial [Rhizobiaceae sp. 2RAB30]
ANHFAIFKFGRNQKGGQSIGILTETFAGAGGARSFGDGVEIGGEVPNPISRMANVETVEATFPVRYLFRKRMKDSGGPGRWRGGTGGEMAIVPHKAPDGGLHYVISGKGARHPMSDGLAGGYPGAPNSYLWARKDSDAAGDPRLPGGAEPVSWGVFPLMGEDALYVRWNGGGGYGDPLEREAEQVADDVAQQLVSIDAARRIYGVVLAADGTVEADATAALRRQNRNQRIRGEANR